MAISSSPPRAYVNYPSEDGQPMAESDFQREPLTYAVEALGAYFQQRADVYVSGNLFIYYEEGNPEAVVAPDVFVVFGAPKHRRSSYMLWNEPKAPDFVMEITSRRTRSQDQGPKRGTYAFLGVQEYVQYDPTSDYLRPPLRGLSLVGDNYELMPTTALPDGTLTLYSNVLGLELRLVQVSCALWIQPLVSASCHIAKRSRHGRRPKNTPGVKLRHVQRPTARLAAVEAQLRALREQGEGL